MQKIKLAAQEPYLFMAKDFLNLIIGNDSGVYDNSRHFWSKKIKPEISKRFKFALNLEEEKDDFNLMTLLHPFLVEMIDRYFPSSTLIIIIINIIIFWILMQILLMLLSFLFQSKAVINPRALNEFKQNPHKFVAVGSDVQEMGTKVKQLNIIFMAQVRKISSRYSKTK
jgi:hypothetical protein